MGIEYCLANHKDKTVYELGRGSWYALCDNNYDNIHLLYEDAILEIIREEIFDQDPTELVKTYSEKIAHDIFLFINNADPSQISLCNDSDDSKFYLKQKGYHWIASRYESDNLDYLNRHLLNS